MKTKIEVGKKYKVNTKTMKGNDGKEYKTISLYAQGDGLEKIERYCGAEGCAAPFIEVLITGVYKKNIVLCDIISIVDTQVHPFAKKPYIRRDGTFTVRPPYTFDLSYVFATYSTPKGSYIVTNENTFTEI